MSTNFNPQPPITGPSSASMHTPQPPSPMNVGGSYTNSAARQYYSGAVRFDASAGMAEFLEFAPRTPNYPASFPQVYGGVFFGDPSFQRGVISFWLQWAPGAQTDQGFPRIGQNGSQIMTQYFGTDPAYGFMGTVEVQLVPLPEAAVEFAPGAT